MKDIKLCIRAEQSIVASFHRMSAIVVESYFADKALIYPALDVRIAGEEVNQEDYWASMQNLTIGCVHCLCLIVHAFISVVNNLPNCTPDILRP